MKWTMLILMVLLMIQIAYALSDCKGITTPSYIPCLVISSWQLPNSCSTYTIKIYNQTPTLLSTITMGDYGDSGRCNITFNYTKIGSYLLNFSSGDTAVIIVEGRPEMEIALIIGVGIAILICLVLAIAMKQIWLKMLFFYPMLGLLSLEINTVKLMAESNNMEISIINMLKTTYGVTIWILYFSVAAGFIAGLFALFKYLKDTRDMKKKRGVPDLEFR